MSDHFGSMPRRVRRGGALALVVALVLLVVGGAYAVGRSGFAAPADQPSQSAATVAVPTSPAGEPLMRWARQHRDEVSWLRAHDRQWAWMRDHPQAWSQMSTWMREHPRAWSQMRHWMREHDDDWSQMREWMGGADGVGPMHDWMHGG